MVRYFFLNNNPSARELAEGLSGLVGGYDKGDSEYATSIVGAGSPVWIFL